MNEAMAKQRKNHIRNRKRRSDLIFVTVILAIPTIHWLIFWLYVNFSTLMMAFRFDGAWSLNNFRRMFESMASPYNTSIRVAVINTLKYWLVANLFNFPLSFFISYFLYKRIKFYKFFRIVFFLPSIITSMILVTVYQKALLPNGLWDHVIRIFGLRVPEGGYFNSDATATNAILAYCAWTGFGSNIILFGSAMSRVPEEMLEAAKLDGCKPMRELFSLILPLIWPTMSTMILLGLTGLLSSSGPILLFFPTGDHKTATLSFWIFSRVYGGSEFGIAGGNVTQYGIVSATGLFFTAIWMPIILLLRKLMDKIPAVEY